MSESDSNTFVVMFNDNDISNHLRVVVNAHNEAAVSLFRNHSLKCEGFNVRNAEDARTIGSIFIAIGEKMDKMNPFLNITNHQLRWYCACCVMTDDCMADNVNAMMGRGLPPIHMMDRIALINMASSFNESREMTARRLMESYHDPGAVGWPSCPPDPSTPREK